MAIDIGSGAIDRAGAGLSTFTVIDKANPANATGIITSFKFWFNTNATGVKVGTFSGGGTDYTSRDVEVIGNVTAGSEQTFSGLSCDVVTGDFAGIYFATGDLEVDTVGGSGCYDKAGDQFGTGVQAYSSDPDYAISVYGTGTSLPTITTSLATSVEATTATLNGNVTATGGEDPTVTVYWGDNDGGTTPGNWDNSSAPTAPGQPQGVAAFTKDAAALPTGTTLYFSAKATNAAGTVWGTTKSFLTKPAAPTAVAATDGTYPNKTRTTWTKPFGATDYHVFRGATDLGAAGDVDLFDDSGGTWGTVYAYTVVASNATGDSAASAADNGHSGFPPTITTQDVGDIDILTATGHGTITATGGGDVTVRGICWNTVGTPTTADPHTEESPGPFGVGAFSEAITGLITNTHYHVRAYGTNALGTTYGNEVTFTTLLDPTLAGGRWYKTRISMSDAADVTTPANRGYRARVPEVTTQAPSAVTTTTMTGNGNIINTAFTNVVQRGFCYLVGTSGDPIITDGEQYDEPGPYGTGAYTKALIGFAPGTNYRIRAFAVNGDGIGYGNTVQVLMKPAAPTNVAATDGTHTGKVGLTWTKSYGATDYHVWRDAVDLGAVGDVDAYDDMGGGPPTITPGVTQASDGTFSAYVEVAIVGEVANPGTTHTYKVVASNATGNSPDSATDTGYRGVGPLTYQIERTNLDDPGAPFSDLPGATTDPFDDTTAPAGP